MRVRKLGLVWDFSRSTVGPQLASSADKSPKKKKKAPKNQTLPHKQRQLTQQPTQQQSQPTHTNRHKTRSRSQPQIEIGVCRGEALFCSILGMSALFSWGDVQNLWQWWRRMTGRQGQKPVECTGDGWCRFKYAKDERDHKQVDVWNEAVVPGPWELLQI